MSMRQTATDSSRMHSANNKQKNSQLGFINLFNNEESDSKNDELSVPRDNNNMQFSRNDENDLMRQESNPNRPGSRSDQISLLKEKAVKKKKIKKKVIVEVPLNIAQLKDQQRKKYISQSSKQKAGIQEYQDDGNRIVIRKVNNVLMAERNK